MSDYREPPSIFDGVPITIQIAIGAALFLLFVFGICRGFSLEPRRSTEAVLTIVASLAIGIAGLATLLEPWK